MIFSRRMWVGVAFCLGISPACSSSDSARKDVSTEDVVADVISDATIKDSVQDDATSDSVTPIDTVTDTPDTAYTDSPAIDVPTSPPCTSMTCDENATCVMNADGQAQCVCNEGFKGDGQSCEPVTDPCKQAFCDPLAVCTVNATGEAVCTCPEGFEGDGNFCKVKGNPCEGYVEPACATTGCPQGQVCDMVAECVPGMCSCDKKTGLPVCTTNCMGGVCIPNPQCQPFNCVMACKDGYQEDQNGCPICACVETVDPCTDFDPDQYCGADTESKKTDCEAGCKCDPKTGKIKCPSDACGPGLCNEGAYCQGTGCLGSKCFAPNHPMSLMMCQGVLDACCGDGECVNGGYCTGGDCPNAICYDAENPVSELLCGKLELPQPQCGVGSCNAGGQYCDNCTCLLATHQLSVTLCGCGSQAQGINTFQKVYGEFEGDDIAKAGVQLDDGGFLFVGWHGMVVRTDSDGEPVWIKNYNYVFFQDVVATDTTYYLLSTDGLVVTDTNGAVQWTRKSVGHATTVALASDGGVVIAGRWNDDVFFTKLSVNGLVEWNRRYAGSAFDWVTHIEPADDGYMLLGVTRSFGAQGTDFLMLRTNADGTLQWARRLDSGGDDGDDFYYYRLMQTSDGGFLVSGSTMATGSGNKTKGLAVKTDANGAVQWATVVGGAHHAWFGAVAEMKDGFVLFGTSTDIPNSTVPVSTPKANVWFSKMDASGGIVWNRIYGDVAMDGNYVDGGRTADGGLYLVSHSHNYFVSGPLRKQHYLLKADTDGMTPGCCNGMDMPLVAESVSVQSVDVTGMVMQEMLPVVLPPLAIEVEANTKAIAHTLCEESKGKLCGGLTTGYLDLNVPYSLTPSPEGCHCNP